MKTMQYKGVMLVMALFVAGLVPLKSEADSIVLSLVVDASGSISDPDFNLQIGAYSSIFGSGSFFDDYLNPGDTLYTNFIWFATQAQEVVPFATITDNATASTFAGNISANATIAKRGATPGDPGTLWEPGNTTHTAEATDLAVAKIQALGVTADRSIIDVSTDGVPFPENPELGLALAAAANANGAGITVNAIGVGGVDLGFLNDYTTAGGGFFVTATDFSTFQGVLEKKLETELKPPPPSVPEPGMLGLFGIGLLGLGLTRKRFQKA